MLPNPPEKPPGLAAPPGRMEILRGFLSISVVGFGGVFPWARRLVVEQRRWLSPDEFNEVFAFCQFLPGPNMLNFAVVFGARCGGGLGALAALAGLLAPPVAIVIGLAALYERFGDLPALRGVLAGEAAAAAGLIIAATLKIAEPVFRRRAGPAPYVAVAMFAAVGLARWPLLWVLLIGTPLSIALAWWWRR
ncbi:MAG TPA: chromate transporter [Xanthobacteraceae bacterium]|nr:chromate transporter [Xanthobacteraceae bacterium]